MKAPIGTNWARTATARKSTAGPRGQMEMFGPAPVPDVVHPQRMGWMYGDPTFDNTLDLPQPRTVGGLMSDMYRASGNMADDAGPYMRDGMATNLRNGQPFRMLYPGGGTSGFVHIPVAPGPQAVDQLPAVLGGRGMSAGTGMPPTSGGAGGALVTSQGSALATQGPGMTLNRPALPGGPIDMGMVERVYPVPATMQGGAPAMVPPADGPGFLARAGGIAARGLGALGALGMAADLFYTPQSDIDILNSAARQGRGRSQGADGPQTQGYSAGPVNSRGQGFTDPRLIRAPAQPMRPAPRPVVYPAPAPVNYDNGGVRTGPNVGIDDETRMAAMRALGIMP